MHTHPHAQMHMHTLTNLKKMKIWKTGMLKDMLMVWKEGLDSHWWIKFLYFFSVALGIKSGTSCILYYWVTSTALGVCFSLGTFGLFACLLSYLFLFSGDRVSLCCSGWSNSYTQSIILPQLIANTTVWYCGWLTVLLLRFEQKRRISCCQKSVLWPGASHLWRKAKRVLWSSLTLGSILYQRQWRWVH